MQSIRSKIFIWLIKNRHLFKMKLKPEVVDASFSVAKFREDVDKATARMKMPKGVTTKKQTINPIFRKIIEKSNDCKLLPIHFLRLHKLASP